jgi:leucyl/phenylalanyl-tRNA--protein transferase
VPIYRLHEALAFPPPEGASTEGIVAVGGDVSPERLVLAYSQGIFPWPHEGLPLLWFSPDPRFVLPLDRVRVARSLRKRIRAGTYEVRIDSAFEQVMTHCARVPRPGQDGTWITDDMRRGYAVLHERGFAHSVESYLDGELVGGLYGVCIGQCFTGESMFATQPDASKVAFVALLGHLRQRGFPFVDCQVHTDHLARFGAEPWPRDRFLAALRTATTHQSNRDSWSTEIDPIEALAVLDAD